MVNLNDNIVGIDSAIFMHPSVWKASGHVDAFNDLVDNKDSKDIEQTIDRRLYQKINNKIKRIA